MSIAILCPNGHRLVCPETQAGKRGKCPQCGATFRVPELPGVPAAVGGSGVGGSAVGLGSAPRNAPMPLQTAPSGIGTSGSAPTLATAAPEPVAPPENPIRPYHDGDPVGDGEIVFLCPNEHHLCGSTSLGGKPGECPECHAKFLVPTEEDLREPDHAAEEVPSLLFNFDVGPATPSNGHAAPAPASSAAAGPAAIVDLFDSFWSYKGQGATIELHLPDGQVIAPAGYAPHLSKQSHGVFMVRKNDGTYTIAAVRWDTVSHITVGGLRSVPEGVFDEGG
jgi:hypothetical protein